MSDEKKTKKNVINNWPDIQACYRSDTLSNRQIAIKYGIAESTLRAKVKKESWQKDLAKQVSTLVNDKVSRLVKNEVVDSVNDEEVVEQVASEKVGILTGHRESLSDLHSVCKDLTKRLKEQLSRNKLTIEVKGVAVDIDIPLDYVGKVVGQVSKSLKDVVELERKSFGLDDDTKDQGSYDEQLVKLLDELDKAEKDEQADR
jgi:hypothetical protein